MKEHITETQAEDIALEQEREAAYEAAEQRAIEDGSIKYD